MTNEVIIRSCQKTPEIGIRRILAYAYIPPIHHWNQSKIWGAWARFGGGAVPPWPQPKTATGNTVTYWIKIAYFSYPFLIRRPARSLHVPFGVLG